MTITTRTAPAAELDPVTLYRILELRVAVFVVEQQAAYPDLDGRDVEPGAELMWAQEGDDVLGTVRILHEPDGLRIGRVATAASARGRGLASSLMRDAVARCLELDPRAAIHLDAQLHLADWYARFGFARVGDVHLEDGIPHTAMVRAAS